MDVVELLTGDDIERALRRLGELARERGTHVKLVAAGGAVMVLRYGARLSTKDVDAVFVEPERAALVRELAATVAEELGWEADWLNDGVKGLHRGCAARGRDAPPRARRGGRLRHGGADACHEAQRAAGRHGPRGRAHPDGDLEGTKEGVWVRVEQHVQAGDIKASYAFEEIWEDLHATIDQLAEAVLARDDLSARALAQELLRARITDLPRPHPSRGDTVLIMAAALAELLAGYQHVAPPSWTPAVGAMPELLDLLPARREPLRSLLIERAPEPLRRRNILAAENFLRAV